MESVWSMLSILVYFVCEIPVSGFLFSCCAMCQTHGTPSLSLKSLLHLCPAPPRPQRDVAPECLRFKDSHEEQRLFSGHLGPPEIVCAIGCMHFPVRDIDLVSDVKWSM